MPTPNTELLRKTLDHIKDNPEKWNQDFYREVIGCGTVMCFAGWASTLAGGTWIGSNGDYLLSAPDDNTNDVDDDGLIHAAKRARRILGLTEHQADDLFHPNQTIEDLERMVGELCAPGRGEEAHENGPRRGNAGDRRDAHPHQRLMRRSTS